MLFNVALLSGLSFASIAQAVPFGLAPQFTRRQTATIGAVVYLNEIDLIFDSIGANMYIPTLKGNVGDSVSFGIALDATDCQLGYLQVGINATIAQDDTTYSARYYDSKAKGWQDMSLDISAKDSVHMALSIDPNDMASGCGTIENLTKGSAAVQVQLTRSVNPDNQQSCGHSPAWFADTVDPDLSVTVEILHAGTNTTTEGMIYPNDGRIRTAENGQVNITHGAKDSITIQIGK